MEQVPEGFLRRQEERAVRQQTEGSLRSVERGSHLDTREDLLQQPAGRICRLD